MSRTGNRWGASESTQLSLSDKLRSAAAQPETNGGPSGGDPAATLASPDVREKVVGSVTPRVHFAQIRTDFIAPAADGQVREDFDRERLDALATSLRRSGMREPIIVTPHGATPGRFQIIAGERRWRAARLAGLAEVPCIVDPRLADRSDKLLAQVEENLHRENLNPVEEARALSDLMESRGLDVRAAGELMGKSDIQARRLYRIHCAIGPIKKAIVRGDLDARAAIELDRIHKTFVRSFADPAARKDAEDRITELIVRIVEEKWSIRRLERYGKEAATTAPAAEVGGTGEERSPRASAETSPQENDELSASPGALATRPLFERLRGRLAIEEQRIEAGEMTPEDREQLIALLEDLLTRVRHGRVRC